MPWMKLREKSPKRLAALCRRIEEVLGGQLQLAPDCPPALESHAQHIAAQLLGLKRGGDAVRHADLERRRNAAPRT